jgi:uncharacterized hydrophobic protein (TIGR00271 family)
MALAEANLTLLRRALFAECVGVVLVLALGTALGLIHRDLPLGHEILARTSPQILDLMIALIGGAASAYALVSPRLSAAVVGVAIATALVPPLTTCGLLLARGLPEPALGAFILFAANFVAIAFAAMIVFLLIGHRPPARDRTDHVSTFVPRLVCIVLLAGLSVHLFLTFQRTVQASTLTTTASGTIQQALAAYPASRLVDLKLESRDPIPLVFAVIRTPTPFDGPAVAGLNEALNAELGRRVELHVRSVVTAEATREGFVTPLSTIAKERAH